LKGKAMLSIRKEAEDGRALFYLEGKLDTSTSQELEDELNGALDGVTELTLDLEKLDYVSSAGLRVILSAQKTMNHQGEMKVINVNQTIMDIFEVTGFLEILTVVPAAEQE
jgi:anti-sigma B factor antagonist